MEESGIDVLTSDNWLYFKVYKNPMETPHWKANLDWYHKVLIEIVRPIIEDVKEIRVVFFNFYGPTPYDFEEGYEYQRRITESSGNMIYLRLRMCVSQTLMGVVSKQLEDQLQSHNGFVWGYEILKGYSVLDEYGVRFGRRINGDIDHKLTLGFIDYLDSASRYILSILIDQENWENNVDVWGIPHLINNALGVWLRNPSVMCKKCGRHLYMCTSQAILKPPLRRALASMGCTPIFYMVCPQCNASIICDSNI